MNMTSRGRIAAALQGRAVDHIPFCPFLAYVWYHFPQEIQERGMLDFHHRVGADPLWRDAPCPVRTLPPVDLESKTHEAAGRTTTQINTPVGTLQIAHQFSPAGNTNFLIEHPLKTEEDFKIQMWIEEHTRYEYDPAPVEEHFAGNGKEGLSFGLLIPRAKSAFQTLVEHLAGTEELVFALADFPDTVETLRQTMVAKDLDAVRLAAQSRYDFFLTWEDSSTQNYSPAQYDSYIGAEIGEWCRLLAGHGKSYIQHACGHVKDLVGRMKNHGVNAVESLSPPPTGNLTIAEARKILGPAVGIIGGIEPTRFLDLPLQKLAPYVESVIADAQGGPFVLANSDSCPPGVTLEKFKLVADIAKATKTH
jgi:hypothetical protein